MPTIPTFTAKGTPTTQVGSVRSNIKVNPKESMAAALAPIGKAAEDYYVKQRDNSDNLEYNKKLLEIQAETDIAVASQKDNPDVEDALANVKLQRDSIVAKALSSTKNKRVRQKIKTGAALEGYKANYEVKIQSSEAFQKDSIEVYNTTQTQIMGKIKTTKNPILSVQYRKELYFNAEKFNKTHTLGEADLKERIKTIDRVLLLTDAESLIGTENAISKIAKLDNSMNGSKLLPDKVFNKQLYNSYVQKIESIAIKGDPNADYEEAERLLNELQDLKRGNGSKIVSEEREKAFAILKQKTLTESINHDAFVTKIKQGTEFFNYQNEQKKLLESTFFNPMIPTLNKAEDKEKAAEAGMEFESRINQYTSANPDATYFEQQQFARQLRLNLFDKYEDIAIAKLTAFNLTENKFNVVREEGEVLELFEQYKANPEAENTLKTIAKLNGFVEKDGTILINAFMNEYLPILRSRKRD
tara:strand:+ start:169 stop:1584 length:1416 start_codon:yes stop_codon:yes gene_type:complete